MVWFGSLRDASVALLQRDEGATAVEYGLMVAAIAAAVIATVLVLGVTTAGHYQNMLDIFPR